MLGTPSVSMVNGILEKQYIGVINFVQARAILYIVIVLIC